MSGTTSLSAIAHEPAASSGSEATAVATTVSSVPASNSVTPSTQNSRLFSSQSPSHKTTVHLLDHVAGNIRSLVNAIEKCGYAVSWIRCPQDLELCSSSDGVTSTSGSDYVVQKLIFPGVGHFGHCMASLDRAGYIPALKKYIESGRAFFGICVGLQALFEGSDEVIGGGISGLGVVKGTLARFNSTESRNRDENTVKTSVEGREPGRKSVPCIGWNGATVRSRPSAPAWQPEADNQLLYGLSPSSKYYYVHSYFAPYVPGELEAEGWSVATATYGDETYVGALARGNVFATQFHPEKSGAAGLRVIQAFLDGHMWATTSQLNVSPTVPIWSRSSAGLSEVKTNGPSDTKVDTSANSDLALTASRDGSLYGLTRRIIACLDVRTNDQGDLVVTKGDQYDVREKSADKNVRNLGKPVALAKKYYEQGADEITFLNITSFRDCPVADLPMLEVLRQTSETVFVPLTIGGGIRDMVDPATNQEISALDVARLYFASGADKISIGSDAVFAAEKYWNPSVGTGGWNQTPQGTSSIETISAAYGKQAVVISVDPRRMFVSSPQNTRHRTIKTKFPKRVAGRIAGDDTTAAAHAAPSTKPGQDAKPTASSHGQDERHGPEGEEEEGGGKDDEGTLLEYVWYAATSHGGRRTHDVDVLELVEACSHLGAGEILLNAIDRDGTNAGFDLELVSLVKSATELPVIASSGAGRPEHFEEVFGSPPPQQHR